LSSKRKERLSSSTAENDTVKGESSLHLSQKVFWFCASACLVLGTIVFSIQVLRGHAAAIKFMGIEITSAKAEASIIAARDRLLAIRTKLDDASEIGDTTTLDDILPEFDSVLKDIGVAEAAIKRRKTFGSTDYGEGIDTYVPVDGMHDDKGDYYGGYAAPSPSASPRRSAGPPKS
jgi:hypothetical protein